MVSERKNRVEKILEVIMPENFPNLGKEQSPKSRKHRVLETVKPENTPKHTIIKNDENLKQKQNIKSTKGK